MMTNYSKGQQPTFGGSRTVQLENRQSVDQLAWARHCPPRLRETPLSIELQVANQPFRGRNGSGARNLIASESIKP